MMRTGMLWWALALGASLLGASAYAAVPEKPRLRLIGVAEGLPSSSVNDLDQDRAGYLWVATTDGLARYDGVGMRVWRHSPDDPASLPGNYVTAVHVDEADRVWVAIEGRGMSVMDAGRTGFRHFRKADGIGIGSDDVWAIASRGGELWFGTFGGGLHRFGPLDAGGVPDLTRYMPDRNDPRSLPADTVLSLEFDQHGALWIGTTAGLARWTGRDFERHSLPGGNPSPMVYSLTADGDALWLGAGSGLHRRGAGGRWSMPEWSAMFAVPNAVFAVVPDGADEYWIASSRDLWRVVAGEVPAPVSVGARGPARPMYQVLKQANGALWFPVAGVGLGYLRPDWRRIAQFSRADGELAAELYRGIAPAAAGGLWLVGSRGEVELLAPDGTVRPAGPVVQGQMEGRKPISIVEDRQGRLWIGESLGLVRVDRDGEVREWRHGDVDGTLGGPVDLLGLDPDGSLWLSSAGGGVQQRDPHSGAVLLTIPAGDEHGLGVGDLEAMAFDPGGALWVAGGDGLARLDRASGRFVGVTGIVSGDRVFGFAFDGPDALWLQRLSGLERYEHEDGTWRRVEQVGAIEGIPSVEGSGVLIDRRGHVWLPSLRGLFRWDPGNRRLRRFGLPDGLSSQEFIDRGIALTAGGVLAAALADGGVMLFDTLAADAATVRPSLHWDRVEVRRNGGWSALDPGAELTLSPQDLELRVQLRLLAFDDVQANRYFSRLDGHESRWVEHRDNGERVFAGLPPGHYQLHARALDPAGRAAPEQRLAFTVQPPWWRTAWALAGFGLLAAALVGILANAYRMRLRRRLAWQRAEHEREITQEASLAKTRFLATLGHEVRTPMTGVLGMSELLLGTGLDAQQRGYTESIRGAGQHLLRLVNDALDLARIESGRLELSAEPFDLRALVEEVAALMGPLARQRGLAFEANVEAAVAPGVLGDCVRVRQILLNLLSNAIKFTEQGQVTLHVGPGSGRGAGHGNADPAAPAGVVFEIGDTGPGLNEEQRTRLFRRFEQAEHGRTAARYGGSGLGLAISQELANAMGGRIEVDSAPGQGARFSVHLPLPRADIVLPLVPHASRPASRGAMALLLVEDDPIVAEVLTGLLRAQGHRVTHAAHGLAALAEVAGASFDAALLDLDLPGLDGFALARQLRLMGFSRPLIALTARADADAEPLALAAGFDRFLRKPVTGAMLAELIEGARDLPAASGRDLSAR